MAGTAIRLKNLDVIPENQRTGLQKLIELNNRINELNRFKNLEIY